MRLSETYLPMINQEWLNTIRHEPLRPKPSKPGDPMAFTTTSDHPSPPDQKSACPQLLWLSGSHNSILRPLLRIDVLACAYLDSATGSAPIACQNARQVVVIHEVPRPGPFVLFSALRVFLLVFSKDEVSTPTAFASSLTMTPLRVCSTGDGLGDAVFIATLVVLIVLG